MVQYIDSACPNCNKSVRIRTEYIGKRLVCTSCSHKFPATAPDGYSPPTAPTSDAELEIARQRVAASEQEIATLRADLATRSADQIAALQKSQESLSEMSRLRDSVRENQHQLASVRGSLKIAETQAAEVPRFQKELALRQAKIEEMEVSCARIQDLERNLASAVGKRELAGKAVQEIRADSALEKVELKAQLDAVHKEAMQTAADAAAQEKSELAAELDRARCKQLEEVRQQLNQVRENFEKEITDLQTKMADTNQVSDGLRAERDRLLTELRSLEVRHGELGGEHERKLTLVKVEKDRHASNWAESEAKIRELQQKVADLEKLNRAAGDHLDGQSRLGEEFARERDEAIALQKRREKELRAELACLESALSGSKESAGKAIAQVEELKLKVDSLQAECATLCAPGKGPGTAPMAMANELESARSSGAIERQKLIADLEAEKARSAAEQLKWQEQLSAMQERFENDLQVLQSEADHFREQSIALREALGNMGIHV